MVDLREDHPMYEAMVRYYAERLVRVGKHAGGHSGQKARAHMRAHGTWGKASRRRFLKERKAIVAARSATSNREKS